MINRTSTAAAEARQFRHFNSSLYGKLSATDAVPMNLNMSLEMFDG